jgi:uncharacterized Zn finger protein (UPF0148 family)
MIKMKCENCGSHIKKSDIYCSTCGMEILSSEYKPLQKKYMSEDYSNEEKSYDRNENYYEPKTSKYESMHNLHYEEPKRSSGWLPIILFLVLILMIGFVIGLIMFTSNIQSTP